jgi:hypothetical protein
LSAIWSAAGLLPLFPPGRQPAGPGEAQESELSLSSPSPVLSFASNFMMFLAISFGPNDPATRALLYQGTFIPVFYDPENPASCSAACDLNYEIRQANESSSLKSPIRS